MRNFMALAALVAVCGCSVTQGGYDAIGADLGAETRRAMDVSYRDIPFDSGPVHVIASEHGELHTYLLSPCGAQARICGPTGRVGRVERTLDYYVVTGAYRDRTFHLSPGGDGYLTWRGAELDLAWN